MPEATSLPSESLPRKKPFKPGADNGFPASLKGSSGYIRLVIIAKKMTKKYK